jgi:hypothetical protein
MRIRLVFLALLCLGPATVWGQAAPATRNPDYRWPLEVKPLLVSSFGEFRPTHLHAGLDLSTGGRSGLRCHAVADGWIARMRMSPFGYGKALYLQLDVGPLVVYAHLSRFASEIADRAWAEQLRRGGFTFDIYLQRDELRVKRGDVIAWSGASGIGHPHLHFEVRDGDVARNPQTAGFAVPDHVRPTIYDVSVMPMTANSHVEGDFTPLVLPASEATLSRPPVRVSGSIGFAVRAIDKASPGPYRQAPYRYTVSVDGRRLYSAVHERFDYAHNHHSKLDYDQDRLVFDNKRSMQLFARPGNRLQGRRPNRDGRGILLAGPDALPVTASGDWFHVEAGRHEVEIVVSDVAGNERAVRFPILVDDMPRIERLTARASESGWHAVCVARDDVRLSTVMLSWKRPEETDWHPLVAEIQRDQWTADVPLAVGEAFVVRAIARDTSGLEAMQTWGTAAVAVSRQASSALQVDSQWRRGHLQVRVTSPEWLKQSPQLQIETVDGDVIEIRNGRQLADRSWTWRQAVGELPDATQRLVVRAETLQGKPMVQEVPLRAEIVRRGRGGRVRGLVAGWELDVEATTFFDDVPVRMREFDSEQLPLGRELRALGIAVAMESREAPTNRRVQVRYLPEGSAADRLRERPRTALFSVDRSGNVEFLSAERDADGALVGRARYLTVFAVLEDTTPPRLEGFQHRTRRGREPDLGFRVTDAGADLDDDALQVTIDGVLAIPEWDPETTHVSVHPTQALASGSHTMSVVAADRVGNRSENSWTFDIP